MTSPREILIKNIDPSLSFIIRKHQPFTIQFGTKAFYNLKIIGRHKNNRPCPGEVSGWIVDGRRNIIQESLVRTKLPESGHKPAIIPVCLLYMRSGTGNTPDHNFIPQTFM